MTSSVSLLVMKVVGSGLWGRAEAPKSGQETEIVRLGGQEQGQPGWGGQGQSPRWDPS